MLRNELTAHVLIVESMATPRFEKNYYAPEYALLLRLAKSVPWPPEQWRDAIQTARYSIVSEVGLASEGLTLVLCKPQPPAKPPVIEAAL